MLEDGYVSEIEGVGSDEDIIDAPLLGKTVQRIIGKDRITRTEAQLEGKEEGEGEDVNDEEEVFGQPQVNALSESIDLLKEVPNHIQKVAISCSQCRVKCTSQSQWS
jgi:hypothetical protein